MDAVQAELHKNLTAKNAKKAKRNLYHKQHSAAEPKPKEAQISPRRHANHDVQKVQTVQVVQNDPRIVRRLERFERLERLELTG